MRKSRAGNNRIRLIYAAAFIVICLALLLEFGGCGRKKKAGEKAKSEQKVKEEKKDPAEKAREEAIAAAKERPEILTEDTGDILMVVNKTLGLSDEYVPRDLVTVADCDNSVGSAETKQLKKEAADALEEMLAASREENLPIIMRTGYRSYAYQEMLYNSYVASDGQEAADTYSGRPGYSEHQSGLCCDVGLQGLDLNNFTGTDAAEWVQEHSWEYGFIVR